MGHAAAQSARNPPLRAKGWLYSCSFGTPQLAHEDTAPLRGSPSPAEYVWFDKDSCAPLWGPGGLLLPDRV
jgi:hypothetical protein